MKKTGMILRSMALVLLCGTVFFCGNAYGAPDNAEEPPVLREPEGEVFVDPSFEWLNGSETEFRFVYTVTNGSNMDIPETEISLRLPAESGKQFTGQTGFTGDTPGQYSLLVPENGKEAVLVIPGFETGRQYRVYADGKSNAAENADAENAAKQKKTERIEIRLILRGSENSGLVHEAEEFYEIPAPPVQPVITVSEPEKPEEQTTVKVLSTLSVNLSGTGQMPVNARMISDKTGSDSLSLNGCPEQGGRMPAFFDMIGISGTDKERNLFSIRTLAALLLTILAGAAVNRLIIWGRIRRKENQKKFEPRRNLY